MCAYVFLKNLFISSFKPRTSTFWKICIKHNKQNISVRQVAVLNKKFNRNKTAGILPADRQNTETPTEQIFRTASGNLENLYAIHIQCIEFLAICTTAAVYLTYPFADVYFLSLLLSLIHI